MDKTELREYISRLRLREAEVEAAIRVRGGEEAVEEYRQAQAKLIEDDWDYLMGRSTV